VTPPKAKAVRSQAMEKYIQSKLNYSEQKNLAT
jgi:hypothetical protein